MDGTESGDQRELNRALELVRAAYAEAMRKCGMFPGKITEVTLMAELLVADALEKEEALDSADPQHLDGADAIP